MKPETEGILDFRISESRRCGGCERERVAARHSLGRIRNTLAIGRCDPRVRGQPHDDPSIRQPSCALDWAHLGALVVQWIGGSKIECPGFVTSCLRG